MKKILLINPPFYRLMGSHFNGLNLGLSYIAAVLRDKSYDVKIYNADYLDETTYLTQEQLIQHSQSYKDILNDSRASIWLEIKNKIKSFAPDIVGISMMTGTYKSAKIVADVVKEINPDIKVVVGGPHCILCPEETLKNKEFDYLRGGEGEFTFLELIEGKKKLKDIQGLSYKNNGEIIQNPPREFIKDLDSLPFPARDLFLEQCPNFDLGYMMTGRGCPFSCIYCASPKIWQRKVRFRSVDNVIEELKEVSKKYNPEIIYFLDDTFTLNKKRTKEICRKIIDSGLKIKWKCDTRADCLDEELVILMKKAGCVCPKIGVESGSERILKMINKKETKQQMKQAADLIKKQGLFLTIYLMAGFPGETNEDLKETINFAHELKADYYSLSIVAPYYGTELYSIMKEQGKLPDTPTWECFYHQNLDTIRKSSLDPKLVDEFLNLNKLLGKERV